MTSNENRPRGLGFGAGVLAGLLFSGAALLTLSLTTPIPSPPETAPVPTRTPPAREAEPPVAEAKPEEMPTGEAVSPTDAPEPPGDATAGTTADEVAPAATVEDTAVDADEPDETTTATAPAASRQETPALSDPSPEFAAPPTPAEPPSTSSGAPARADGIAGPAVAIPSPLETPAATAPTTEPQTAPAPPDSSPDAAAVSGPAEPASTDSEAPTGPDDTVASAVTRPTPAPRAPEPVANLPATEGQAIADATPDVETAADGETATADETETAAADTATAGPETSTETEPDEVTPAPPQDDPAPLAEPSWRAHAAPSALSNDQPVMSVVVINARESSLPALRTLAPLGSVSVAIAADEADQVGMVAALRSLGHEAIATLDEGDEPLSGTVGLALTAAPDEAGAAAALAQAGSVGGLVVDVAGGATSRLVPAGLEAAQPVSAAALRIEASQPASAAFQVLRNASALAVRDGTLVIALEASPTTLTALGRWLALPGDVQPAPLTALIERQGPTRY